MLIIEEFNATKGTNKAGVQLVKEDGKYICFETYLNGEKVTNRTVRFLGNWEFAIEYYKDLVRVRKNAGWEFY